MSWQLTLDKMALMMIHLTNYFVKRGKRGESLNAVLGQGANNHQKFCYSIRYSKKV